MPNLDKRPGKDGQQYIFHGCSVLIADDTNDDLKVIFVILAQGMLIFAAPLSAETTMAKALSPSEVELYLLSMPPSPAADELRDVWKQRQTLSQS